MFWFVLGVIVGGMFGAWVMAWFMSNEGQVRYDEGWRDGRKYRDYGRED